MNLLSNKYFSNLVYFDYFINKNNYSYWRVSMDKVICTSFFFGNSVSQYINMKNSNINSHNEIYMKTVVCFFSSARFFSEEDKLCFFVNDLHQFESIGKGSYKKILDTLNVDVIEVNSYFVDRDKKWAGSMFVFDTIEYILNRNVKSEAKKGYFFFDTDVIFLNHFERVFKILEKYNWGGYARYTDLCRGNNWLEDFHGIDFGKDNYDAIPYGGEFLYLDSNTIEDFFKIFEDIYLKKNDLYYTEEHYYSAIFNTSTFLDNRGINVHTFFKRAWRVNKSLDDQYIWALHFPGEKNYKLNYLFTELKKDDFKFNPVKAKKILGVKTFLNYYDIKKSLKKIKSKISVK